MIMLDDVPHRANSGGSGQSIGRPSGCAEAVLSHDRSSLKLGSFLGYAPLVIFLGLLVYLAISAADFITLMTLDLILQLSVPIVILCIGLSVVVMAGGDDAVSGGIDLSIPASAVLGAAIVADQIANRGTPLVLAMMLAIAATLVVGLVNANMVARIGMTPLLATLATSVATVGVVKLITSSRRIDVTHQGIVWLRDAHVFGVSVTVLIVFALVLVFYFLLHRTIWGINLQAVGGNRDAAEISGIATKRFIAQSFILSAFIGGVASVFVLARGSGSSPGTEENLMMEMVLATFLGAAFSPRRVVTLWGAVLGAVLVAALSVGFKSIGVDVFWTGCIKGALILIVVASASLSGKVQS